MAAVAALGPCALAACGTTTTAGSGATTGSATTIPAGVVRAGGGAVLRVPAQYRTIQAAVDHARAGDLVLVSPGTYREAVTIKADDVELRGLDRNRVVLDGGDTLVNGVTVNGDGDVVDNLTTAHYAVNGVLFTKAAYTGTDAKEGPADTPVLTGYRASYVTAYDNGLYGIYAFAARSGQLDHDDASGQPDSGIYIGQCHPCDALVTGSTGEHNRVGFEAANASGGLEVVDSTWDANRAGMVVESSSEERLAPQDGALLAGNLVVGNDDPQTPSQDEPTDVFGYGIVVGGGADDVVRANRVEANSTVGILLSGEDGYGPSRDTVSGDVSTGNGVDLALTSPAGGPTAVGGSCFSADTFTSSQPAAILTALPCGGGPRSLQVGTLSSPPPPPGVDYSTLPAPAAGASMPDAATAPAASAAHLPAPPTAASVALPPGP